jgi:phage repressor protein C with HTH and peptisase S24 domain
MTEFMTEQINDDLLDRLAVHAAMCEATGRAYEQPRLAHWLAHTRARESGQSPESGAVAERAEAFARALASRITAARMERKYPRYALHERSALVPGTFAQTVELAARERCAPRVDLRVAAGLGRELWDESCDAWVELPNAVPLGQYVALTVSGDSMTPLLHDGDVILVSPHVKLARDSVIVARRPDEGYVVKHVARLGRTELELASLNPAYPPFTIARRPELIVGTVVGRLGYTG